MIAFVQTAVGEFERREVEPPTPGPGEVVLRVRAALTCGTDVKILRRGHAKVKLPTTMGHEACGEVAAVGAGVTGWRIGDRAVPGISGPCGRCAECRDGRANLCSGGAAWMWGTFAELVRIPAGIVASNLHRVPDGLEDEVAAFLDPLAAVLHGWSRLGDSFSAARRGDSFSAARRGDSFSAARRGDSFSAARRGDSFGAARRGDRSGTLLLYGAGALAFLWAAVARRHGLDAVIAGRRGERAALAERYGARFLDVGGDPHATPRGADAGGAAPDAAVDCTGDPAVWERLAGLVRPGGEVVLFGGCAPGTRVSFDAARLHYAEVGLVGSFHYTPADARAALEALASGAIDPRPLLSGRGGLEDLPRLLDAQGRGDGVRYAILAAAPTATRLQTN